MELSSSNIKEILCFLKRKLFLWKWDPPLFSSGLKNKENPARENVLYFRKRKPRKNFLYFLKGKLLVNFGKMELLYFRKQNFLTLKIKKFKREFPSLKNEKPTLKKWHFLATRLETFLYFSKELAKCEEKVISSLPDNVWSSRKIKNPHTLGYC